VAVIFVEVRSMTFPSDPPIPGTADDAGEGDGVEIIEIDSDSDDD